MATSTEPSFFGGARTRIAEAVWRSLLTIKYSPHVYQIWVEALSSARWGTAGRWMMRSAHNCKLIQSSVADTRSWLLEQGTRETNVSRLFISLTFLFIYLFFYFALLTKHSTIDINKWTFKIFIHGHYMRFFSLSFKCFSENLCSTVV